MQNIFDKSLEERAKRIWKLRQLTGLMRADFAMRHSLNVDKVRVGRTKW